MKIEFPLTYSWFIVKGLTAVEPWYFIDTKESIMETPNWSKKEYFNKAFCIETGADFEVYLFARRQDREDFAFFLVRNGKIEDKVITCHLSFSGKRELVDPYREEEINHTFMSWMKDIALNDIAEWITEEDLIEEYE